MLPIEAADPPTAGWWQDPNGPGFPLQRYHDGSARTEYVCRFVVGNGSPSRFARSQTPLKVSEERAGPA
jgi:hypothetical protein